jgi:hypothetical protein
MSNTNRKKLRIAAAAVVVGGIAAAGGTLARPASAAPAVPAASTPAYAFTTLDNANDLTFNQLLGINNHGTIAGYFGIGSPGHPNKGYQLFPPYGQGQYVNENFPHSVQTQVTGINDNGDTVGFFSTQDTINGQNNNFGWYKLRGKKFHEVNFPTGDNASPPVDQLLGVNNHDVAAGFWTDAQGADHGYTYNIKTRKFSSVTDPNEPGASLTAAAINNKGDIAGFYTNPATGAGDGFLLSHGKFTDLAVPGAVMTQALGVNDHGEVVGDYQTGTQEGARMHGFTWTPGGGFVLIDDPDAAPAPLGATVINGVNDKGDLVGFYLDANQNFDGFLATPERPGS